MMVGGMMDEKAVSYIVHESMMARQECCVDPAGNGITILEW